MQIKGTDVNVRSGPGLSYEKIDKLNFTTATVLGSAEGDGYTWYQISYNNGASTGYVAYDPDYIEISTYNPDIPFEQLLWGFPESYRDSLRVLHTAYPNWVFIPDPVHHNFTDLVMLESENNRKQIVTPISHRSMGQGCYDWSNNIWVYSNGGWTGASKEIIAYYMDPRNFLNPQDIFMFFQQSYNSSLSTIDGVRSILQGTFLANGYYDPNDTAYGGDYAQVIMAAAQSSGVNPYVIAAKIRQEIGVKETELVKGTYTGYEGYYNFYNFKASGTTQTDVIEKGLIYAKNCGWNTRSKSIIEGAIKYNNDYVSAGQDTYYYQDFNFKNVSAIWHQYAQAVYDAKSKGKLVSTQYTPSPDSTATFKIPMFDVIPDTVAPMPPSNDSLNNYYLSEMTVSGLTPSFNMFTNNYSLYVYGDTAIKALPIQSTAYIASPAVYDLAAGNNTVTIKVVSQSGNENCYNITVSASVPCKLYVNSQGIVEGGGTQQDIPVKTVLKGDTNGDGAITLRDLANVRLHLLGLLNLTGDNLTGADTNGDGTITLRDLANVRLHLLGILNLTV